MQPVISIILIIIIAAVSSGASVVRVPTDCNSIQTAIKIAHPDDTILLGPGIYRETVTLKHSIILQGTDANTCRIVSSDVNGPVIRVSDCNGVVIENISLTYDTDKWPPKDYYTPAIEITNSGARITRCRVLKSPCYGILLTGKTRGIVENCIVSDCCSSGIYICGPNAYAAVSGNHVHDCNWGIAVFQGTADVNENDLGHNDTGIFFNTDRLCRAQKNTCIANAIGLWADKCNSPEFFQNVSCSNKKTGIAISYSMHSLVRSNTTNNNQWGILVQFDSDNTLVERNDCNSNVTEGIWVYKSRNVTVHENRCAKGDEGIGFCESPKTVISGNLCISNRKGISLRESCPGAAIRENNCFGNLYTGIFMADSDCLIKGNSCRFNHSSGIRVKNCASKSSLTENACMDNYPCGMEILNSDDVEIKNNTCARNPFAGIMIGGNCSNPVLAQNKLEGNGAWALRVIAAQEPNIPDGSAKDGPVKISFD
jgi:parallel beta-helix repeat protein